MDIKDIVLYLKPQLTRVEACINTSLKSDIPLLDSTNRSLRENGGKMIRPVLALLAGQACGSLTEDSIRFAAAAELLHNATLLHDDVVDGATERRGKPTVAALLNGSAAVLIGDFWLVRCMQVILDSAQHGNQVIRIFAKTLADLAEGELLQMQKAATCDTTQADYIRIIYNKTASLFESSALSVAISVHAEDTLRDAVTAYARHLGLAFQIRDDMLDYESDDALLGKPVGIDLKEQKITQPLLCALEMVPAEEAARVRNLVAGILDHPELAEEVHAFVIRHNGFSLARQKLDEYVEKAISCLDPLPESMEKHYLTKLARFVGNREK